MKCFIISLLMTSPAYSMNSQYMPVVLMPGISSDVQAAEPFKEKLEKKFPSIYVKIIAPLAVGLHNGWIRIEHVRNQVQQDLTLMSYPTYNMICHSQGTLDGRGLIETRNDGEPPVHNYIGLSGPQAGEFGLPDTLIKEIDSLLHCKNPAVNELLNQLLKCTAADAHDFLYTNLAQDNISFAGYWKDPLHYKEYLTKNRFLTLINNEKEHNNAQKYKRNIMALNSMILVASLHEYEIKPHLSSHFCFYKQGSTKIVQTFDECYNANYDPLGLWQLNCQNKLKLLQADCLHTQFWNNQQVFDMVAQYAGIATNAPQKSSKACCCDLI